MFGFFKKKKKKEEDKIDLKIENQLEDIGSDDSNSDIEVTKDEFVEKTDNTEQNIEDQESQLNIEEEQKQEQIKKTWLGKLKSGLSRSSSRLNDGLKNIFVRKKLDQESLDELEELLITADIGINNVTNIIEKLSKDKFDKEITKEEVKEFLSIYIREILDNVEIEVDFDNVKKPYVLLVCGVNGAGKTTTIGKLANMLKNQGKSVMFAACDTYRAAAVEQLEVWAKRADCEIVTGDLNSDPASVAFRAYEDAINKNIDILIVDTAGRLQNKKNLMDQLAKISKVLKKHDEAAPHDTMIVLDATTGQNANSQVKIFNEVANLTSMVITKLDGTAKGGVVINLAQQFKLPIWAIGVGESIDDLQPFTAKYFVDNLLR